MTKPKKRPEGRPSKYKPEYCAMLLKHMGTEGLSYESFAATIGVSRDTLYHWESLYPRFSYTKRLAIDANLLLWEKLGIAGMTGKIPGFNAPVWNVNMKNRHGWRERVQTENNTTVTGSVDVNLNASIVNLIEELERDSSQDPEDC